ncbi:T9SS type A sorting domain-containing protein [Flavihumibacter sp. ZG627]|uniref:T9SS type A sorting domain-containing protein n=1 Tax=Flavihumibacter sp. ZG627 TaxID=1463156 RepID=UPI00058082EF|nr:T9SS type A sorting domain-containing protein [Flavihumibacter sp. ZG627]KIC89257.1 hypothetical protein HY58_17750 [Flavihumibacter sp. ZG627]
MKTLLTAGLLSLATTFFIPASTQANTVTPATTLKLRNFMAAPFNGNVKIEWIASAKLLNGWFEIERSNSRNGNYEKLATVPLRKKEDTRYWYSDTDPFSGDNYYRIKLVDANRNTTYTKTILVKMDGTHLAVDNIFPSVAQNQLNLQISSGEESKVKIDIIDMSGRSFSYGSLQVIPGTTRYPLNITALHNGSYMMLIKKGDKIINRRFIKQ